MNFTGKNSIVPVVLCGSFGLVGAYYAADKIRDYQIRRYLTSLRLKKQREREEHLESLEREYQYGADQVAIVSLPFDELVRKLQARELKAREVLEAYVSKAVNVTRKFNCVTEFIDQAFERADELDALPKVKGPLHGVPICIKDDHNVQGMDSTLGFSINLYKPKDRDAIVIQLLQEAGANPFCKTNVPQTLFSIGSDNPIFGTTVNPLNTMLGPGGSSSGTACLIAAGGALIGTGSDIGGSVRIPAHFCGIATLKPTGGRLSGRGVTPALDLCAGVTGVSGILSAEAKTLVSVYSALFRNHKQHRKDPVTAPLPWNPELYSSKQPLRIGYFTSLSYFPTIGDTPDTVMRAKDSLEAMGHTLVPFDVPDPWHLMDVFNAVTSADGGNQIYKKLKNDEISPVAAKFMVGRTFLSRLGLQLTSLISKGSSRDLAGDPAAQRSEILWKYLSEAKAIQNDVLDKMSELMLDAILSPVFPFPAPRLEDADTLLNGFVYTAYWNLVDFPCGNVPFGTESGKKVDAYNDEGDMYLKLAKEGAKFATGMPIGVQIIGKPYQEETVIRLLVELEDFRSSHSI